MAKKLIFGVLIIGILFGGVYFYWKYVYSVPIKTIIDNPRMYEGKSLIISGKVLDRVSLIFLKYFRLQDKTGEIIVVTSRTLPALGDKVRVKGKVVEAFTIGDEQLLVFLEEDCLKKFHSIMTFVKNMSPCAESFLLKTKSDH
ncbi:MAG: hypothetical protein AB1638_13530 [Nitrospirota bacterium]